MVLDDRRTIFRRQPRVEKFLHAGCTMQCTRYRNAVDVNASTCGAPHGVLRCVTAPHVPQRNTNACGVNERDVLIVRD